MPGGWNLGLQNGQMLCALSLGDVIDPDCQIDLNRDEIDFFDPNLKPDFDKNVSELY